MEDGLIRILLVERDPIYADHLVDGLADDLTEVVVVADLEAASARAASSAFDVAVLGPDFSMSQGMWRQARAALPTLPLLPVDGPTQRDAEAADVLGHLGDVVLTFTITSRGPVLTGANRRVDELLGLSAHELTANPERLWGHLDADDAPRLVEALAADRLFLEDAPRLPLTWFDRHGGRVTTDAVVSVRRDVRGRIIAADVALRLDGDRAAAEKAIRSNEHEYRLLADQVADAVFRLRVWPRMSFDYANNACAEVLGVAVADLRRDPGRLLGTAHADHVAMLERALQDATTTPTTIRYERVGANGVRTVELSLTPVRDDRDTGVELLGIARDVTLTAQAEASLRDALRRDEAASHASAPQASAPAEATVAVTVAGEPSEARTTPDPSPSPVREADIAEVVVEAVARTDLGARTVTVTRESVVLRHDVVAVRRAITILLENVRRHTPAGTRAMVTIAEAVDSVLITVSDDGPGFAWEPGSAEAVRGSMQLTVGSGSVSDGLGAVAAVAQAHGGRAWIQSSPGRGTNVRMLLRADLAHSAQEPAVPGPLVAAIGHNGA